MLATSIGEQFRIPWKTVWQTTLLYWVLWAGANWPGIRQAWWYADDLGFAEGSGKSLLSFQASHGRPLAGVWLSSIYLDAPPSRKLANVSLRVLQGLEHSFNAALAAVLVCPFSTGPQMFAAGLPLLLWPFHADAVLWRAGSIHVWAALISLLGLARILSGKRIEKQLSKPKLVGALVIALSTLVSQATPWIALIVYLMRDGVRMLAGQTRESFRKNSAMTWVLGGLCGGGTISFTVGIWFGGGGERVQLSNEVLSKLFLLLKTHYNFWFRPLFNSMDIILVHSLFLLCVAAGIILHFGRPVRSAGSFSSLLLIANPIVLAIASFLIVRQNGVPWRGMYLMPLCVTSGFLFLIHAVKPEPRLARAGFLCILAVSSVYGLSSWKNSGDYPRVMQKDLSLARDLEVWMARESKPTTPLVVYASEDCVRVNPNPYGLNYVYHDDKVPAFYNSADSFLRTFTRINISTEPRHREACRVLCRRQEPPLWERGFLSVFHLPSGRVLCGCVR